MGCGGRFGGLKASKEKKRGEVTESSAGKGGGKVNCL